ncbi:MAG: TRL-like family protein [Myxococcota bacterium]
MKKLAATLTFAMLSTGCASAAVSASPPSGALYTGVKGVGPGTQAQVTDGVRPGPKQGQTCASGVLGLAAWGDMSLDTAKKTGGITRVDTVDYSSMRILGGVYVKNCTVITGE